MPRARISATGARPDPSFRFEPGQCITLTSRSASSACSRSVTHTQCAAQRRGVARPVSARYSRFEKPARQSRGRLPPRRATRTRACARAPARASDERRDGLEQLARARHREARRERGVQPAVRRAVPSLLEREALVDRSRRLLAQPRRRVARPHPSCTCRPTARSPIGASVSKTTSVSWTVSIVRTVRGAGEQQLGRGQAAPRRGASTACARLPSARRAASATRAAACRRPIRGTASGTGGCASG